MIFTPKSKKAIRFATKTHEIYQKQKRKGKDIPYITHPLAVGLILARANASEDVVVAGIVHDTIAIDSHIDQMFLIGVFSISDVRKCLRSVHS
jgi:(p)ppGpp synthase/HD superfamily hydrolase